MSQSPEVGALIERIANIDPVHADTMREQPTEFTRQPLPFYTKHTLLQVIVELPHRPMALDYLDDGEELVQLAGAPADVYRVNSAERLQLTAEHVADYVKFFVRHAEQKSRVVEAPQDLTLIGPEAGHAVVHAALKPVHVERTDAGFRAVAVVLVGRSLKERTVFVDAKGSVREQAVKVLLDDVPVAWAR